MVYFQRISSFFTFHFSQVYKESLIDNRKDSKIDLAHRLSVVQFYFIFIMTLVIFSKVCIIMVLRLISEAATIPSSNGGLQFDT